MTGYELPPMALPRVASGALFFDRHGRTLLVKPTYKELWDIPGGYVEPGETPRDACAREVLEELGLDRPAGGLLVVDWAPLDDEGDKILFVFDGGELTPSDVRDIALPDDELSKFQFFDAGELATVLTPRLSRRVQAARQARQQSRTLYLENGATSDA